VGDRQKRPSEPEAGFLYISGLFPEIASDLEPRFIERLPNGIQCVRTV